jgi:hypothetical protein
VTFELGGQTNLFTAPAEMAYSGMTWVKVQHKWHNGDAPAILQSRITQAHNAGFKILYSIPGQVYPLPGSIDFAAYVAFLGGLAALPDPPDAIEVWNEPNIDFEWPAGEIDPAVYVAEMLQPAYSAIKAANPDILVISAGLAPTGFDNDFNAWSDARYLAGMVAAGAADYLDCVGVHHNSGATSPDTASGHPAGDHYTWYYEGMVETYFAAFGGQKPLCFTELGYLTPDGFPSLPPNFWWANGTSLAEHAAWLALAAQLSAESQIIRFMIVFNVDFDFFDPAGDPQAAYAMIRPNGACPACDTLRAVMIGTR